ncbi:MAG TPA: Gfo/Idh/MocA family oxidoreductase [Sedimentisphaerales bacterium]|nr:Gfo/Idh/MocA family oxidoreductase [Sedimentisphaerales bacterium]
MRPLNRREFMKGSIGAAVTFAAFSQTAVRGANEKVIVGVMGLGGRGTQLAEKFAQRSDVEIAYLCDADTRRFARAREAVEEAQNKRTKLVQDFRKILDDGSVDVVINATPDHWHGLGTIMACQAGKDVYVEKPMAHNIWEGGKMIEAARKYKRVVQVGMQSRSAPYTKKAKEYIESGKMGDIHVVRVFNMMQHPKQKEVADQPVPEGFDYDMWCGPAPKLPYNPSRRWLNQWEYSCGPIPGDAVHQLDLARYLLNDIPCPKAVSHAGGVCSLKDRRETPDTQLALFDYGELTLMLEAALWTPYMKKTSADIRDSDRFPNWPFSSTKVEILGTEGFMYFGRHGGGWQAYDAQGELVRSEYGRQADKEHQDNFIECIRTRKKANADVEVGYQTVLLCHMANISYRVGNQRLEFDPQTQTFTNCDQANKYLKREYRAPWIVPETV